MPPTMFVVLVGATARVDSIWTVENDALQRAAYVFREEKCRTTVEEFTVDDGDLPRSRPVE